eukprot:s493_g7.t1
MEVNLHLAFSMMLQGIRYQALGYEGDWRIWPNAPAELQPLEPALREPKFQLLDNKSEPRHVQPKLLHQLRPEQLRSLYWMVQQEENCILTMIYRCYWQRFRPDEAAPKSLAVDWTLDCRVIASFGAHGGVLADEMGYGKTVLAIALHDVRQEGEYLEVPEVDALTSFQSPATLICIPPHLHAQWQQEIKKFTGTKYKVLDISNKADLQKSTVRSFLEADLVLCNYDLLRSMPYIQRRAHLAHLVCPDQDMWSVASGERDGSSFNFMEKLQMGISSFVSSPSTHAWSTKTATKKGWSSMNFPVLEMFFFRRVIFDELHELQGETKGAAHSLQRSQKQVQASLLSARYAGRAQADGPQHLELAEMTKETEQEEKEERRDLSAIHHLRSHHFWGLTATPLMASCRHVSQMAKLLRVDVAGPGSHLLSDADAALRENCQRFLDGCVRRNTAEVPKIAVKQHLKLVKHTPQERALYLSACADAWSNTLQKNQRLLILCSHFSDELLGEQSATEACGNLVSRRRQGSAIALERLEVAARWGEALRRLGSKLNTQALVDASASGRSEEAQSVLTELQRKAFAQSVEDLTAVRLEGEPWCARVKRALSSENSVAQSGWAERCESALRTALEAFLEAQAQLKFLEKTLELIGKDKERSCVICYQENLELEQLGITPCAHYFCLPCLTQQVERNQRCGVCRHPLKRSDIQPLMHEMEVSAHSTAGAAKGDGKQPGPYQKFGSKLGAIVQLLKEIKLKDSTAKCIVFCQWDSLLTNIARAFHDFGIRYARLHGSVYARTRTLANFQGAKSNVDVLLLSLEHSASGTNLTCANHVILVHPMSAESSEQSIAFELQAIGRVRRWGQPRNEVHVWRFCTLGTIEEEITKQHQKEIYESSQSFAAQLEAPPAESGNSVSRPLKRKRGPRDAVAAGWSCRKCGLSNEVGALLCSCGANRPGLQPLAEPVEPGHVSERFEKLNAPASLCIDLSDDEPMPGWRLNNIQSALTARMRDWHRDPSAKPEGMSMPPETQELLDYCTAVGIEQLANEGAKL